MPCTEKNKACKNLFDTGATHERVQSTCKAQCYANEDAPHDWRREKDKLDEMLLGTEWASPLCRFPYRKNTVRASLYSYGRAGTVHAAEAYHATEP